MPGNKTECRADGLLEHLIYREGASLAASEARLGGRRAVDILGNGGGFVHIHGKECGFGAHDFPFSGVFEVEPRSCPGFIYRCSISLGCINMPLSEFRTFLENAASVYHGRSYHLITKNCNHFTDEIAWRLTGKHIPGWVNRLARVVACFPNAFKRQLSNSYPNVTSLQKTRVLANTLKAMKLTVINFSRLLDAMYVDKVER